MRVFKTYQDFDIAIFDDPDYNPNSVDNSRTYNSIYCDKDHDDYMYVVKHGIEITCENEIRYSALVASSGGMTCPHSNSVVIDKNTLAICCGDSVFFLTFPTLDLLLKTQADSATCFEIFEYESDFIIHGELEITRIDKKGNKVWTFSGSDIFTSPTGKDDFKIIGHYIYAINWDRILFKLSAETGQQLVEAK